MAASLVVGLVLFLVGVAGARLVDALRPAPRPPRSLRPFALHAAAVAAVFFSASLVLDAPWIWAVGGFAVLLHATRTGRDTIAWRRFFRVQDEICTTADPARVEAVLGLGKAPSGYRAHERWVGRILLASHRAHELDRTDRALAWLGAIDVRRLTYDHALALQQYRAAFAMALGHREVARDVLSKVPPRTNRSAFEEPFAILRALLDALDGDASERRLREAQTGRARATLPQTADGWATVEAHVLAARGDAHGAREILAALRERHGDKVLARIVRHAGPASPLAASVVADGPYR